jgi:hypothetical protein
MSLIGKAPGIVQVDVDEFTKDVTPEERESSGLTNARSAIYTEFLRPHMTESRILDRTVKKKDTSVNLKAQIMELAKFQGGDKDEQEAKQNADFQMFERDKTDVRTNVYKFRVYFNRLLQAFKDNYKGSKGKGERAFLKFIYDLIKAYSITYQYDESRDPDTSVPGFYNHFFKHYFGKDVVTLLREKGLNNDEEVIADLLRYTKGDGQTVLDKPAKGGGLPDMNNLTPVLAEQTLWEDLHSSYKDIPEDLRMYFDPPPEMDPPVYSLIQPFLHYIQDNADTDALEDARISVDILPENQLEEAIQGVPNSLYTLYSQALPKVHPAWLPSMILSDTVSKLE